MEKGYAGKISNEGSQEVKALHSTGGKRTPVTVKRGKDLRNGGK